MTTHLDHLVFAAATLEQGVAYIRDTLGVDVPKGGEHPLMGTHNHVMRMGDELFLEIIAVNPKAPPPDRPRWFSLDDMAVQESLKIKPRLLTWAVNTDNLDQLQSSTEFSLGKSTALTRGELHWLFAVPDDGRLLAGGMIPNVLQWQSATHPAKAMNDLRCRLVKLSIHHPYPEWITSVLQHMGAHELVSIEPLPANTQAYLRADIETPGGVVVELDSRFSC